MMAAGLTPDPWQMKLFCSTSDRILTLTHRQGGKSTVTASIALQTALTMPHSLTLLLSRSERQSGELAVKVSDLFEAAGRPLKVIKWTALQLALANGSRIIALPGEEKTIRCYSGVSLLVIDEAARVPDALYWSVRPMLGVSKGRLICLSTPFGQRGWFYEEWISRRRWQRFCITAEKCPRLTPEFLAEERASMGERYYSQEYLCSWEAAIDNVFSQEDIDAAATVEGPVLDL
jgi:hypothetical protein